MSFAAPPSQVPSAEDAIYVQLLERWQSPPPEIENRRRTAWARVFLLQADHSVVEHFCYLIESGTGWAISGGDGHVVTIGSAEATPTGLTVRRRVVFRTVRLLPPAKDPLCESGTYSIRAQHDDIVVEGKLARLTSKIPLDALRSYIREAESEGTRCGG